MRLGQARALARTAPAGRGAAVANQRRDEAAADADVAAKRADLNAAVDAEQIARLKVNELAVDAPPSEREQAFADIREAADKVAQARADLQSSPARGRGRPRGRPSGHRPGRRRRGPGHPGRAPGQVRAAPRRRRGADRALRRRAWPPSAPGS